jgi:hypothetical protein
MLAKTAEQISDYLKYRGKCKEMSEELCASDPTLRLVRGYYHCPIWGKQQHWWTEKPDGTVVDPTVKQFPSAGLGDYEEFDGNVECEFCGNVRHIGEAYMVDHHVYCSDQCYARDIGF